MLGNFCGLLLIQLRIVLIWGVDFVVFVCLFVLQQKHLVGSYSAFVPPNPQVLLCRTAAQPLIHPYMFVHVVILYQLQDLVLVLGESHPVDCGPFLRSIQVILESSSTHLSVCISTQLGVVSKFAKKALNAIIHLFNEILNKTALDIFSHLDAEALRTTC